MCKSLTECQNRAQMKDDKANEGESYQSFLQNQMKNCVILSTDLLPKAI